MLRPRPVLRLAAIAVPVVVLALVVKLALDEAEIVPRIWFLALQFGFVAVLVLRARVVVAGGVLWRRVFRKYSGVDLADLQAVELVRAFAAKNEGGLRVLDSSGRMFRLQPVMWSKGARPLLAGLGVLARQQGLVLNQRTTEAVDRAASTQPVGPQWTATVGIRGPLEAATTAPKPSTLWVRRDTRGIPTKTQPGLVLVMVAVMLVLVPGSIAASRAVTTWLRARTCGQSRHLWTSAALPAPVPQPDLAAIAQLVAATGSSPGTPQVYRLDPSDVANEHNTEAVRRGAQQLSEGLVVQWIAGDTLQSEVYLERFDGRDSAIQFHRAYADDHCRYDKAFRVPQILGAVGFRCRCRGDEVNDRVSFVRGDVRVQAIVWTLRRGADHQPAVTLAGEAVQPLGG